MCSPRLRIMAVAMMLLALSALVSAQDNEVNAQASFVRKISEKGVFICCLNIFTGLVLRSGLPLRGLSRDRSDDGAVRVPAKDGEKKSYLKNILFFAILWC